MADSTSTASVSPPSHDALRRMLNARVRNDRLPGGAPWVEQVEKALLSVLPRLKRSLRSGHPAGPRTREALRYLDGFHQGVHGLIEALETNAIADESNTLFTTRERNTAVADACNQLANTVESIHEAFPYLAPALPDPEALRAQGAALYHDAMTASDHLPRPQADLRAQEAAQLAAHRGIFAPAMPVADASVGVAPAPEAAPIPSPPSPPHPGAGGTGGDLRPAQRRAQLELA